MVSRSSSNSMTRLQGAAIVAEHLGRPDLGLAEQLCYLPVDGALRPSA